MRTFSPRERRLIAVLLLLLAVAIVWIAVIRPIANGFADRALRRDVLLATWQRDERIIGQLPSLTRAAAAQRRDAGRFRLAATGEAGATALLTTRLTAAASATGGSETTVESVAAPPGTARVRIGCRLDPAQLGAFLARIENGVPMLTVDALSIDATSGAGDMRPGLLDVHVEVSAFYPAAPSR